MTFAVSGMPVSAAISFRPPSLLIEISASALVGRAWKAEVDKPMSPLLQSVLLLTASFHQQSTVMYNCAPARLSPTKADSNAQN
jgi:hypothetical protein